LREGHINYKTLHYHCTQAEVSAKEKTHPPQPSADSSLNGAAADLIEVAVVMNGSAPEVHASRDSARDDSLTNGVKEGVPLDDTSHAAGGHADAEGATDSQDNDDPEEDVRRSNSFSPARRSLTMAREADGSKPNSAAAGEQKGSDSSGSFTKGAYFIGKAVWGKVLS
jgi:hypothetical protein